MKKYNLFFTQIRIKGMRKNNYSRIYQHRKSAKTAGRLNLNSSLRFYFKSAQTLPVTGLKGGFTKVEASDEQKVRF